MFFYFRREGAAAIQDYVRSTLKRFRQRPTKEQALSILNWLTFACLLVVAASIPHSTLWVKYAFRVALALWFLRYILGDRPLINRSVLLPLLLFMAVAGISTIFSFVPLTSWNRLESFGLLMLAVIGLQTITSGLRLKLLLCVLLLSATVSCLRTGWQYTAGIGTRITFPPNVPSATRAGLQSGDVIQQINSRKTRNPSAWRQAVGSLDEVPGKAVGVVVGRDAAPPMKYYWLAIPSATLKRALTAPGVMVSRAHPARAQGHFYHYIPYAGLLTELALLTWGLLIAGSIKNVWRIGALAALYVALSLCLVATVTRSYLGTMLFTSLLVLWMVAKRPIRLVAIAAFIVLVAAGSIWFQKERSLGWVSDDAGTQYRLAMWKDGLRLIGQHPLLGVGLDSVMKNPNIWNIEAYRLFPPKGHFHSTPVEIAVDLGLPALGIWIWLWTAYLIFLFRLMKRSIDSWVIRGTVLGAFGASVALLLSSFVQYNLGDTEVMDLTWLLMGCVLAVPVILRSQAARPGKDLMPNAAMENRAILANR